MRFLQQALGFIFYGNLFYAACTILLCIETNLVAGFGLNHPAFYIIIGAATLLFYGIIYYRSGKKVNLQMVSFDWQSRLHWYAHHRQFIKALIWLGISVLAAAALWYLWIISIANLKPLHYLAAVFFPSLSVAYSYQVLPFKRLRLLREAGTLKPFILGFAWAGFVTVYPMMALIGEGKLVGETVLPFWWLFIQNFIFISVLCILFDIKDVEADGKRGMSTIPVVMGVPRSITSVILPLIAINLLIKYVYFIDQPGFATAVMVRSIPYLLIVPVAMLVRQKRSTLFYLALVDGLMLVKAVFGIASVLAFRGGGSYFNSTHSFHF